MNTAFFWLVTLPLAASPLVYIIGRVGANRDPDGRAPAVVRWLTFLVLLATWIPFGLAAQEVGARGRSTFSVEAILLQMDGISLVLAATVLAVGTAVALYSGAYMAGEVGEEKYYAMLLAMMGVMIGLGCAGDLFNLWVWFEAMAVSSYLLVAFYREQPASLEAGMKYLVQSALGSVLVLLGIALVLAQTGTLDLDKIRMATQVGSPAMLAAGALFVIGFGVKIAMVPMHTWLPDAHSQAPSGISAMLSGVVIEAGLVALLRALMPLAGVTPSWGILLMGFGALNMLYGNLLALRQEQVKRLLAFSSLSHVGYMLLGLGISLHVGQAAGAQGAFFHLFNHGLMKGLAFLAAGRPAVFAAPGRRQPRRPHHSRSGRRGHALPAGGPGVEPRPAGPGRAAAAGRLHVQVADLRGRVRHAQHADRGPGDLRRAEQRPVAGLLRPAGERLYRKEPSAVVQRGAALPGSMLLPLVLLSLAVVVLGLWPSLMNWLTEPAGAALMKALRG